MEKQAVADTGALISLETLPSGFEFIKKRYDKIVIPQAVADEISFLYDNLKEYLIKYKIKELVKTQDININREIAGMEKLHKGEAEAVSLAFDLDLPILIEEEKGRRVAIKAGLEISGIGGEILLALNDKTIDYREFLDMLRILLKSGRINQKIYNILLEKSAVK